MAEPIAEIAVAAGPSGAPAPLNRQRRSLPGGYATVPSFEPGTRRAGHLRLAPLVRNEKAETRARTALVLEPPPPPRRPFLPIQEPNQQPPRTGHPCFAVSPTLAAPFVSMGNIGFTCKKAAADTPIMVIMGHLVSGIGADRHMYEGCTVHSAANLAV